MSGEPGDPGQVVVERLVFGYYADAVRTLEEAAKLLAAVHATLQDDADILPPNVVDYARGLVECTTALGDALRFPKLRGPCKLHHDCGGRFKLTEHHPEREAWSGTCGSCGAKAMISARGAVLEFLPSCASSVDPDNGEAA